MKVAPVKIGNSRGVRLPKAVLEQCGFTDEAELTVQKGRIVLAPAARKPREGWEEAFAGADTSLTAEHREWLDARLTNGDELD